MNIAEHRPPLRRIEIGAPIMDRRREADITEALSGVGPTERDRIWKLVVQVAQGVNAPTQSATAAEDLGGVLVPDDVAKALRSWIADNGGF